MRSLVRCLGAALAALLWIVACDQGYQSPSRGPECEIREDGTSRGCEGTQVCLASRCYEGCVGDDDCSRWERCSDGACRSSSLPRDDGGITPDADADTDADSDADADSDTDGDADDDGGPASCEACPDRCHGVADQCVECAELGQCVMVPVCDVGRGGCTDESPGQCAPCDPAIGSSCGGNETCVDRRSAGVHEVVCLSVCSLVGTCPQGTTCDAEDHCVPATGVSCSGWHSSARSRSCTSPDDCGILGSGEAGVVCSTGRACGIACTDTAECPAGRTCNTTGEGLCLTE